MSAESPPSTELVLRTPSGWRVYLAFCGLVALVVFGAAVVAGVLDHEWSSALPAVLIVVALSVALAGLDRSVLTAGAAGVVVRNFWSVHHLRWDEVDCFAATGTGFGSFGAGMRPVVAVVSGRHRIAVWATAVGSPFSGRQRGVRLAGQLEAVRPGRTR
jgi:hypothetical protein